MDVRELKKIVEIMNQNDLAEVEIEEDGKRLRLKKAGANVTQTVVAAPAPVAPAAPVAAATGEPAAAAGVEPGHHTITAPMVGTYYRSPSPDADAYVQSGDKINPESIVCILEAMKVMNEIKAECSGEIVKVCVENGEAVEYGQPLFIVKSA